MKLSEIPIRTDQEVKVVIDGEFDVFALVGKFAEAGKKNIAYLSDAAFLDSFLAAKVDCVICTEKVFPALKDVYAGGICISADPKTTFFAAHDVMAEGMVFEKTKIGDHTTIHPTAVISEEGVVIGNHVSIGANVVIQDGTIIGDNSIIMAGTVLGAPAFYYYGTDENRKMVESTGTVCIGRNVTIHPNSTICKGVLSGKTLVDDYSSIDSHVFIGHDALIGKNCIIAAGASFGGWSELGDNSFVGVNASVAPTVRIGMNAKISIGGVVTKNVMNHEQVSGNFAINHDKFIELLKEQLK